MAEDGSHSLDLCACPFGKPQQYISLFLSSSPLFFLSLLLIIITIILSHCLQANHYQNTHYSHLLSTILFSILFLIFILESTMTTYVEQYFLYGDVGTDMPLPGSLETLVGYADLTAGAAIVFAALILLSLVAGYWETLSPFVFTAAKQFILSPIQAVLSLLGQYASEFFYSCWCYECRYALRERLTRWVVDSHLYRLVSTVANWHFPGNRPFATLCCLSGTYVGGLTMYTTLLIPGTRYFSGLVGGWNVEVQSPHCPSAISRYYLNTQMSRRHLSEAYYCLGEKSGLKLHALTASNLTSYLSGDGEIDHFYPIVFVAITVLLAIAVTVLHDNFSQTAAFQLVKSYLLRQSPYPHESPMTQKETDLWNMITQYEADLDSKKAQLANHTALLNATRAKLSASKRRQEEGWSQFEKLVAGRNVAVEAHSRELSINSRLRQQLIKTGGQLKVAEGRLKDENQKLIDAQQQVVNERKQLASERRMLELECQRFSNEQQQASEHPDPIEERQRLAAVHDQLAAERQQLAYERQGLADERKNHVQQYEELVDKEYNLGNENLDLMIKNSELTNSLQAVQQERDAAMTQVVNMQQELESTNLTANITLMEAQKSLSQTQQTEAAFHQSVTDIRTACDQVVMQERSAADQARRQVSSLTADFNDLQSKIGMAMRDAQRSHEQAVNSKRTIGILEHRLAKYETMESGSTQEVPKRQTGNTGSMSTALAQKEVVAANQLAEISDLKRRLEQAKQGSPRPSQPAIQENFQKLREALEKERRERTTDNVCWGTKTRELEADNQ